MKKVLEVNLSELTRVRLRCRKSECGIAIELPLDGLANVVLTCPVCRAVLNSENSGASVTELLRIFRLLKDERRIVDVAFALDAPPE